MRLLISYILYSVTHGSNYEDDEHVNCYTLGSDVSSYTRTIRD